MFENPSLKIDGFDRTHQTHASYAPAGVGAAGRGPRRRQVLLITECPSEPCKLGLVPNRVHSKFGLIGLS